MTWRLYHNRKKIAWGARAGAGVWPFWMGSGRFPAFPRRGGCAHQRLQKCAQTGRLVKLRSLLIDFRKALLMELRRLRVCLPTAPSAPIRTLRDILLMAQPPRLRKAGNWLASTFFLSWEKWPILSVPLRQRAAARTLCATLK